MKNEDKPQKQTGKNKISHKKYIIAADIILFLVSPVFIFILLSQNPKPDPASEKVICEIVAKQLNKNPSELTKEDLKNITQLELKMKVLSDLWFLPNFTNLRGLSIEYVSVPERELPIFMKILIELGIYNPKKNDVLDLSPLKKLSKLEKLKLSTIKIKNIKSILKLRNLKELSLGVSLEDKNKFDIKPFRKLKNLKLLRLTQFQFSSYKQLKNYTNLEELHLNSYFAFNIEPLKNLKNLKKLDLSNSNVSDLNPIKGLTNLREIQLYNTNVTDIEPLSKLQNLRVLNINNTPVSNIKPLEGLSNLKKLFMGNYPNITDPQVEDLQKALPNLEIIR